MHIEQHFLDVYPLMGESFKWRNHMSIHLETGDLINAQQMEVAVKGPDGATHLILCTGTACIDTGENETYTFFTSIYACCTGTACIDTGENETYTFFVGPHLSRRQFVGAIASGAIAAIQVHDQNLADDDTKGALEANLISIGAKYDEGFGKVKVRAEVSSTKVITKLSIAYNVNILAEMPPI